MISIVEVGSERCGGTAVVHVAGEVDMSSAPTLRAELLDVCATVSAPALVVVDLARVEFFGSAGLEVLVEAHRRCETQRTPLRIVAIGRPVLRTFQMCGLDTVLGLSTSLANAMAATVG